MDGRWVDLPGSQLQDGVDMVESTAPSQAWRDSTAPPEQRAEALLAALADQDKLAIALGEFEKVAHLGLPPLRYTDGPNGVRGPDTVTAFPASLAMAAAFDEQLAAAFGAAIAEEARDTGSNVLLGPAVDIARAPLGGRLPEAMGEDPYLTSRLASAEVVAIQDRHVVSMVKHFIGNNAETCRTGYAVPDGRSDGMNTVRRACPSGQRRRGAEPRAAGEHAARLLQRYRLGDA